MTTSLRWTSADLELLPDDGKRYEIIDGELYVSRMPTWAHQAVCFEVARALQDWSDATGVGSVGMTPGLVFAEDDDVAPDLIWASKRRLAEALGHDGHLHGPPELVVEVLSPGASNRRRDLEVKLKLYSRRGVDEYWIADWPSRTMTVYRRDGATLELAATLGADDLLGSPLLPGFSCRMAKVFAGVPEDATDRSGAP
ncbi:MAG: Uma2 family endonuclease [Nocardioidaceae bacterium]